jgi:aspartyl/glutamyl-tRNA(asn/gln) amidotransferase, C subunit
MTKITKDTVKKMAQLGNIEITEDEANSFALDIERTLAYVDQLKELDTDSIEPTYQVTGLKNVWRKDVIEKPLPSCDDLLQCDGNNILNSQIKVPKVL